MITRDTVQGFIDGHKLGHPEGCLKDCAGKWLENHHTYPSTVDEVKKILGDLDSYKK